MKMSTAELLVELNKRAVTALHSHSLYSPSSVGWLNANDPNPELIGYAMWFTDGPSDTNTDQFGMPVYSGLDIVTKGKLLAGEDFTTFLELSWQGIGLTLLYAEHGKDEAPSGDGVTWYQLVLCFVALTIASDRIKDLFITATFGIEPKQFKRHVRNLNKFTKEEIGVFSFPFIYFVTTLSSGASKRISMLSHRAAEVADMIRPLRSYRNTLVHRIASQNAKTLEKLMRASSGLLLIDDIPEFTPIPNAGSIDNKDEIMRHVNDIRRMYDLLIRIGSDVLEIEYLLRRGICD